MIICFVIADVDSHHFKHLTRGEGDKSEGKGKHQKQYKFECLHFAYLSLFVFITAPVYTIIPYRENFVNRQDQRRDVSPR